MASIVEICNRALIIVGEERITDLPPGDKSKGAQLCAALFAQVRDEELRRHPWAFAKTRTVLGNTTITPSFGYRYSCRLPVDCLRLLRVENLYDYAVEGNCILSNADVAMIQYVRRVTDPNEYTSQFIGVLATKLALEMSYSLEGKSAMLDKLTKAYADALHDARFVSATEGAQVDVEADDWLETRL